MGAGHPGWTASLLVIYPSSHAGKGHTAMTPTTPTPDQDQAATPPTSRRAPTTLPDVPHLRRRLRLPDPATPSGALLYAVLAGLIVWFVVTVLPHHIHLTID